MNMVSRPGKLEAQNLHRRQIFGRRLRVRSHPVRSACPRYELLTGRLGRPLVCLTAAIALTAPLAGTSISYASTGWSPPTRISGAFVADAVSCSSTSFCGAIEYRGRAATYSAGRWSAPEQIVGVSGLTSLSCADGPFCVGVNSSGAAVTYFDGRWSASSTFDAGHRLMSVSCASMLFCAAVDENGDGATYDGSTWSASGLIQSGSLLTSVSCAGPSFCVAVGAGMAVTYTAGSWSAPVEIDNPDPTLRSVSCASSSFCMAVNYDGFALTYDGSVWTKPTHTDSTGHLYSVSCASATFCVAVGGPGELSGEEGVERGEALTYNGSSWSAPQSIDNRRLDWVSCASAAFCVALDQEGRALYYPATAAPARPAPEASKRARLYVRPQEVRVDGKVRVSGSVGRTNGRLRCPAGDRVELISRAFTPNRQRFHGVPTAFARVRRDGEFATTATIPSYRRKGLYSVSGRCGSGNLGVSVRVRVVAHG